MSSSDVAFTRPSLDSAVRQFVVDELTEWNILNRLRRLETEVFDTPMRKRMPAQIDVDDDPTVKPAILMPQDRVAGLTTHGIRVGLQAALTACQAQVNKWRSNATAQGCVTAILKLIQDLDDGSHSPTGAGTRATATRDVQPPVPSVRQTGVEDTKVAGPATPVEQAGNVQPVLGGELDTSA